MEVVPPREWPESGPILGREATWNFYVANTEAFSEGLFDGKGLRVEWFSDRAEALEAVGRSE
jgi:hypothetical protein